MAYDTEATEDGYPPGKFGQFAFGGQLKFLAAVSPRSELRF